MHDSVKMLRTASISHKIMKKKSVQCIKNECFKNYTQPSFKKSHVLFNCTY